LDQISDLREKVSDLLKEADHLIKIHKYDAALEIVNKAKFLDPSNPYTLAFFERIEHFKHTANKAAEVLPHEVAPPSLPLTSEANSEKNNIRLEVEKEYQIKFKEELQKIEKVLIKRIESERERFEQEKIEISTNYEAKLLELKNNSEKETQDRLNKELLLKEKIIKDQFYEERAHLESDIKKRIEDESSKTLEDYRTDTEKKIKKIVEKEKEESIRREGLLKQEYENKLQNKIDSIKSENEKLKQEEIAKVIQEVKTLLTQEFAAKLETEVRNLKIKYENEQLSAKQQYTTKQKELEEQANRILSSELQKIKERENAEREKRMKGYENKLRTEITEQLYNELEEKKNALQKEYENKVQQQNDQFEKLKTEFAGQERKNIEEVRNTLKKELEAQYIHNLEKMHRQFTYAYDDKMDLLGVTIPKSFEEKLSLYKKRLKEFWIDGQPGIEIVRKLMELKELLDLSFDDHTQMEMDVRIELYISKIEEGILKKTFDPTNSKQIDDLKQKYLISTNEATKLEPFILSIIMKLSTKGIILVVDDDELLLKSLENLLTEHNYRVLTATSVGSALEILENNVVDLIISDIKFPDVQNDGFSFFSVLQKHSHLSKIPFLIMSVLGDGGIVRSGVQLGIDDYIIKPIDTELLLAVIEGKLKRYKNLNAI
jgi:CheY-like chemotaxis protein